MPEWTPARDVTPARGGSFSGPEVSEVQSVASNENHPVAKQAILEGRELGRQKAEVIRGQDISDDAKGLALSETAKQYAELAQYSFKAAERAVLIGSTRGAVDDIRAGWYQYGVAKGLGADLPAPRFSMRG